ncbi:hypothetical protein CONPUDRAFT_68089 [Coniophora puteana RWD-64-598 SS2]|uniref:DUF6589 domain-containing protein n=1 Tax=Coniophora puteana (strain RWD-64-598) TaxID=741705 RepID=R7SDM1_CONPW|nr:uncharacterized protein CONPUDRAFT_68089 [Coniophora puteana RWD-64-598 SS2]EIW73975.1 hypothetical protein CONPUDRAFT_68089 [Coniophora puteana RWD-64-598 SS2]
MLTQWAVNRVGGVLEKEGEAVKSSRVLLTESNGITAQFLADFSYTSTLQKISQHIPVTLEVLRRFATTKRQKEECGGAYFEHKEFVIQQAALTLLGERSIRNSLSRHVLGLYMYAGGASRQLITIFNRLGSSVSYVTLAGRGHKGLTEDTWPRQLGTLEVLSQSVRAATRKIAKTSPFLVVYDNINMMWRVAEQVMGRKDTQENGTCATLIPLWNTSWDDLQTADLVENADKAHNLKLKDLRLTRGEDNALYESLVHCVMRIVVRYGGPQLAHLTPEVLQCMPASEHRIEVHKTDIYPLPAMDIDESSTLGNLNVLKTVFRELHLDDSSTDFAQTVKFIAGDQSTIARDRVIEATRAGNEGGAGALRWAVWMPGLFHYKMAATHAIMITHLGLPNHDLSNPASLSAHNAILQRKVVLPSALPPFRTCRDLAFVSLYARVLHCMLLVSGKATLEELANGLTLEGLRQHADTVVSKYTDAGWAETLREEREDGLGGDMVFESALLFLRDALLLREFTDAIKIGDSGRVVNVLKVWVMSYRGAGRNKYAYETMVLIHNIQNVWPERIKRAIFDNWLANPTGRANAFVEVDLVQEHLNFWTKNYYQAHGSNASWEWLRVIAPCVDVLRKLATNIHAAIGAKQGTRHAIPNLSADIKVLMDSLALHQVYQIRDGRTFSSEESPPVDVVSAGTESLAFGTTNPLYQFNEHQRRLQTRRRTIPLTGPKAAAHQPMHNSPATPRQAASVAGNARDNVDSTDTLDAHMGLEIEIDTAPELGGSVSTGDDEDDSELQTGATGTLIHPELLHV